MTQETHPGVARALDASRLADILVPLLASLAIGLLAQLSIPIGPVPVTGQTLAVLAAGAILGPRRGTAAVALYLAQGVAGLPVFAGGTAGPLVLLGPTAGYLIGFVPAAWLTGTLFERIRPTRPGVAAAILTLGTAVIYAFGAARLGLIVGWERVVAVGIAPFLVGDALKIAIVSLLSVEAVRSRGA